MLCFGVAAGQKSPAKTKPAPAPVIFAVLHDGKTVEPIALVQGNKLSPVEGDEKAGKKSFGSQYYSPDTAFTLIFGGAADGTVKISKSNAAGPPLMSYQNPKKQNFQVSSWRSQRTPNSIPAQASAAVRPHLNAKRSSLSYAGDSGWKA